ncbi:unnamed protein product [Aphis gossypii]|uniref:Uncharacterized protein n=1 Tax=Aphis gossypii TaxID=80765 RepID=A0A9P0J7Z1_APHGO|nr:unnamed protein product [Aphis gossypii]
MSSGKRTTITSDRSAADRRAMLSISSAVAADGDDNDNDDDDDDNNSEYGLVRGGGIVLKRGRRSTELQGRRLRYVGGDAGEDRGPGEDDESDDEIADGASESDYETADGGSESDYETDGAGSDSGDSPLRSGDGIKRVALIQRMRCICVSDGESSAGETTDDSTAAAADG